MEVVDAGSIETINLVYPSGMKSLFLLVVICRALFKVKLKVASRKKWMS
ncbi:MAG: hypothetical protein P4L79_02775 [Legionella sp.]|nr:hypothetical protein [Legionella sp.]